MKKEINEDLIWINSFNLDYQFKLLNDEDLHTKYVDLIYLFNKQYLNILNNQNYVLISCIHHKNLSNHYLNEIIKIGNEFYVKQLLYSKNFNKELFDIIYDKFNNDDYFIINQLFFYHGRFLTQEYKEKLISSKKANIRLFCLKTFSFSREELNKLFNDKSKKVRTLAAQLELLKTYK